MATEVERLVAVLEARTTAFEKALAKAVDTTNTRSRQIEKRFEGLSSKVNSTVGRSMGALVPSLAGVAAALGTDRILAYAEAWTRAQNVLRTSGVASDQVSGTLASVYEIAQRQGTALSPLVTLYGRVAQAGKDLGASSSDIAQFTEGVATALRVAGTSSEEASGALLQLSQLLGSGTVRAEEFNSVMEGARPILQTVASGLEGAGGSVNRLRTQVLAGTVSSREFFQAFLRGMDSLEADASKATDTVGQAMNRLTNALTRFIGETDQTLGVTQRISQGLTAFAKNFDTVGNAALIVGTALGVGFVTNAIKSTGVLQALGSAATIAATDQYGVQRAILATTVASRAGTIAVGAFRGALSLLGGPVGLAITGVSVALAIMSARTAESEARWASYTAALDRAKGKAAEVVAATGAAAAKLSEQQRNAISKSMTQQSADMQQVLADINAAFTRIQNTGSKSFSVINGAAGLAELEIIRASLGTTVEEALKAKEELYRLANSDPRFQMLADKLAPLLDKLAAVRAAAGEARTALENVGPSAASMIDAQVGKAPPAYDAQLDPTLRGAATTGYINEQTKAYRLAARERKLQADAEAIYQDAQSKGIELTKSQARGIAEFREQAEKADQAAERFKGFQQGLKGYGLQTNELELEAKLIGASTFEATRQIEVLRMLNQAKMDQIALSPQMLATIEAEASRRAAATAAIEDAREKQQRFMELQQEFGDLGVSSIQGLIEGTKSFNDVLKDGISLITQMLLKATLLGQGPLAGLFGGSVATSNSMGGLLGMIFGGFRAGGGPVANGRSYIVGEKGPELFTPGTSGAITPNSALRSSGGGQLQVGVSVDDDGKIQAYVKSYSAAAAQQGAAAGASIAMRATPGIARSTFADDTKRRR